MMASTRDSLARMSSRSLIVSSNSLYSRFDLVDFQAGELIEAQFEDGVGLGFAEAHSGHCSGALRCG